MTEKKTKKRAKPKQRASAKTVKGKLSAPVGHSLSSSRVERYYTRIVVGFVAVTAVLVSLILYFSFTQTVIKVYPQVVSQEFVVTTTLAELGGVMVLTDVEGSSLYTDLSSTETREGTSSGTVTLVNNYTKDQPLVETTRLMSDEGVLFRTQETVTVPAGGSVEVKVAADEPGTAGDIGPSRFTIVALWEGLQKDIYGTSSAPMTGGEQLISSVTATEIENARNALKAELLAKARTVFEEEVPTYEGMPESPHLLKGYRIVNTAQDDVDAQIGDEVSSLTATQSITVAAPVVNADLLVAVLQERLNEQLDEGIAFVEAITLDNISVEISELSEDYTEAEFEVTVVAETKITEDHELMDKTKLTNRSEQDIREYLTGFDEIASIDLDFSPFWVTRAPSVADNITLTVE